MRKILVIDDEPAIRLLLAAFLREEGYLVVEAANGWSGAEVAAAERPDLVLTDVMMPRLDGPGLIQQLRAAPDLAAIPVVLMTAVDGALPPDVGAIAVIRKPFDLDQVLQVVASALAEKTP